MGVPGLYGNFFKRRYPSISRVLAKPRGEWQGATDPTDNLFVDMNHVIHSCTHANATPGVTQTEEQMFAAMEAYIDVLVAITCPTTLVFIAIDGVAPVAKMNQQRTRRFLSAHVRGVTERVESEVLREMSSAAGGALPCSVTGPKFDPNIISPGTAFMDQVAQAMRRMFRRKIESDPRYARIKVVISDAYEPAEGEHKIMRFIRHLRTLPGYNPNTRHVIYGQDADLLLLSLLCHEPHMRVLREAQGPSPYELKRAAAAAGNRSGGGNRSQGGSWGAQHSGGGSEAAAGLGLSAGMSATATGESQSSPRGKEHHFEEVEIGVLRECLQWEFSELVGEPTSPEDSQTVPTFPLPWIIDGPKQAAASVAAASLVATAAMAASMSKHSLTAAVEESRSWWPRDADAHALLGDSTRALTRHRVACARAPVPNPAQRDRYRGASASAPWLQQMQQTQQDGGSGSDGGGSDRMYVTADLSGEGRRGVQQQQQQKETPRFEFERVLVDFVLLTFLVGNDFLPHIPSLDIYDNPSGLELLLTVYKQLLPDIGHLSADGAVNPQKLQALLQRVARDEGPSFERRAAFRRKRFEQQQQQEQQQRESADSKFWDAHSLLGGVSMGALEPGADLDAILSGLSPEMTSALGLGAGSARIDYSTASHEQIRAEFAKQVSTRATERVMSSDPWAADPCKMGQPGFRERYYRMRFPELGPETDLDWLAGTACKSYLDGLSWVLRYYCNGPATLVWAEDGISATALPSLAHQSVISSPVYRPTSSLRSRASHTSTPAQPEPEGASWTWCYPHHYAPLVSDLANAKLLRVASRQRLSSRDGQCAGSGGVVAEGRKFRGQAGSEALSCGPVRISRGGAGGRWSSTHGPCRPLLQLASILPPCSASDVLPPEMANLLFLAESLNEVQTQNTPMSPPQQAHSNSSSRSPVIAPDGFQTNTRGKSNKHANTATRSRQSANGLGQRKSSGGFEHANRFGSSGGGAAPNGVWGSGEGESEDEDGDEEGGRGGRDSQEDEEAERECWEEYECASQGTGEASEPVSLAELAGRICSAFPAEVTSLVDMSGKKYLHQGVVALPFVALPLMASTLQLALGQGQSLSVGETARNRFRPSQLLVAGTVHKTASTSISVSAAAASSTPAGTAARVITSPVASPSTPILWELLTTDHSVGGLAASPGGGGGGGAAPAPAAYSALGGVLGMMFARRAGHEVVVMELDVAALPVAHSAASLLPGSSIPRLRVSAKEWRQMQATSSYSLSNCHRVLGFPRPVSVPEFSEPEGKEVETRDTSDDFQPSSGFGTGDKKTGGKCRPGGNGNAGGGGAAVSKGPAKGGNGGKGGWAEAAPLGAGQLEPGHRFSGGPGGGRGGFRSGRGGRGGL